MKNKIVITCVSLMVFSNLANAFSLDDILESEKFSSKKIKQKFEKEMLELDVKARLDLANIDLIDGVNLASQYRYSVEPSYQDKYFTRIDQWNLKGEINPGVILQDYIQTPLSFSISKDNSFLFVRQFKDKNEALKSRPYTPAKLPLNYEKALKLNIGDFVSIPANLNLAVSATANSALVVNPTVLINGSISGVYFVNGEFQIQIFKIDETHIRLKLIANRSQGVGASARLKTDVSVTGFEVTTGTNGNTSVGTNNQSAVEKQANRQVVRLIDRLVDRDFIDFGMNYAPGASYIADYILDLSDEDAQKAYNQILGQAFKLKDIVVFDNFFNAQNLKDKLITTTELADKLSEKYKDLPLEQRKVIRVFKGFNNFKSYNRHLKLGIVFATFQQNSSYANNKITFIDKNDKSVEFFYPTFTRFVETNLGKWFFNLKDQSNKIYFGLIPRKEKENIDKRSPDLGLTFERRDKNLTTNEHYNVGRFIINQLPTSFVARLKLDEWRKGNKKVDSRIYFQSILKSQGFVFLKKYNEEELNTKLTEYLYNKNLLKIDLNEQNYPVHNGIMNITYIDKIQIKKISNVLFHALNDAENVSEDTVTKIIKLNEYPVFNEAGLGFLISLLPEADLEKYIYIKLNMIAKDVEPINAEFGTLNYKALYHEINSLQSRISNRSYDLRVNEDDLEFLNMDNQDSNFSPIFGS